ncbi:MAG: macro domain-containing protein [Bacilli bacterium]
MLIYKTGDILEASENIICHQVNEDGYMGGGLALQIAEKYPHVENEYKQFCNQFKNILYGQYQVVKIAERKYIVNCFTQRNFITSLEDIEQTFRGLLESCKLNYFTIAIPYKYGCGIAKGNWDEVSETFEKLSNEYEIDISVYRLENVF